FFSDTWKWSNSTWTQLSPSSAPSARADMAMAMAPATTTSNSGVVLFGGASSSSYLGDTWVFSGGAWTQKSLTTAPGARSGARAYFSGPVNSTIASTFMFGGYNGTSYLNELWSWDGNTWAQQAAGATARSQA